MNGSWNENNLIRQRVFVEYFPPPNLDSADFKDHKNTKMNRSLTVQSFQVFVSVDIVNLNPQNYNQHRDHDYK